MPERKKQSCIFVFNHFKSNRFAVHILALKVKLNGQQCDLWTVAFPELTYISKTVPLAINVLRVKFKPDFVLFGTCKSFLEWVGGVGQNPSKATEWQIPEIVLLVN